MTSAEVAAASKEDSGHERLLKLLDFETIQALQAMRKVGPAATNGDGVGRSIPQAAEVLGIPTRTLTRTMLTLDEAYHAITGQRLVENAGGRVGYRLTEDGAEFAVNAGDVQEAMAALVHDLSVAKGRLSAPTTKACIPMLKRINDALLARAEGVWLDPAMHRTADIHRPRERETAGPYAFYSIGLPQWSSKPYYENQFLELENGAEMIVFRAQRFRLLAPLVLAEELNLTSERDPVSIKRVLRGGWTLLIPDGGAVYDFLDHNTPGWGRLGRPPKDILDLQAGLMCLTLNIYQRTAKKTGGGVMLVHDEHDVTDLTGLGQYKLYDIEEGQPCWALTGMFRDPHQLASISGAHRRRWNKVWQLARRQLWRDPNQISEGQGA